MSRNLYQEEFKDTKVVIIMRQMAKTNV